MPPKNDGFFEREARRYSRRYDGFTFNVYEKLYQRRRIDAVVAYSAVRTAAELLDAGCGSGDLLKAIRERNPSARLTGFDLSQPLVAIAQSKQLRDTTIFVGSVLKTGLAGDAYGAVCCIGVLPYIDDIDGALRELFRVLKRGGVCYVTYPYNNPVVGFLRTHPLGMWIKQTVLKMAHFTVALTPPQFEVRCRNAGFTIQSSRKLPFSEYLYELQKTR
jgi:ubiquinone/menaquinone biosynthesis C-methylase UbiE